MTTIIVPPIIATRITVLALTHLSIAMMGTTVPLTHVPMECARTFSLQRAVYPVELALAPPPTIVALTNALPIQALGPALPSQSIVTMVTLAPMIHVWWTLLGILLACILRSTVPYN
jgi:hypothetical protein